VLPKRFDQTKPFFVLGVALLAWLILPTVVKRVMRLSFFEFEAPVDAGLSGMRDLQDFWSMRTRSKNELIEAGKKVANLNAHYETSLQKFTTLEKEITRLEDLLRLPSFAEYRSEPARVARRDFNGWWQRLVIRKGRNYGIAPGSPVIFVGGVVGRISEVGAYTSTVDLISNPGVRIAASIEGDTRPISYQGGNNPTFGVAKGTVEFVPNDVYASPAAPKRLVTSGFGGVFPPGLYIGQITRVEPSTDGLFKTGDVVLDQRMDSITEVTVLVPLRAD
jgi:rod shape-determining protein MreC